MHHHSSFCLQNNGSQKGDPHEESRVMSIVELQTINGNLINGQVAAANGNVFIMYAHNLPTFDLLKKPVYQALGEG